MNGLENLSVSEIAKHLSDEKDVNKRRSILKSVYNKSIDYIENHARWGEVLDTENHENLNIGDRIKYKSLYFREEVGYVAGFFQPKSLNGSVKPAVIPENEVEYSIPLQNSIEKYNK